MMARVGLALGSRRYELGLHNTATLGTLGAAAAAAHLLGLDAAATENALGVAATQSAGLRLQFGWRVSFVVIAALGFVWLAAWWTLFRDDPASHPRVSPDEAREIASDRMIDVSPDVHAIDRAARPLLLDLLSRPVLGVALAFFSCNYVLYFFLSWLPSYLTDYQHLVIRQISVVGILPWLGATVGFVAGGTISDRIYRRTGDVLFARMYGPGAFCKLLVRDVETVCMHVSGLPVGRLPKLRSFSKR